MPATVIRIDGRYRLKNWVKNRYAIAYEIAMKEGFPMVRLKLECTLSDWCYDAWHKFEEVEPA